MGVKIAGHLIYLQSIFAILKLEISSLMTLIFSLFQTWILQTTAVRKIQIIKLGILNWKITKI